VDNIQRQTIAYAYFKPFCSKYILAYRKLSKLDLGKFK